MSIMERRIQPPLVDTTACLCRVDAGLKTVAGAKRFVPGSKLCLQPDIKPSIHPTRQKPTRDRTLNQSPLLTGLPDDLAIACLIRVPRIEHRKLRWERAVEDFDVELVVQPGGSEPVEEPYCSLSSASSLRLRDQLMKMVV
ncbi:hypothetical protein L1987_20881 [Smallanthus sonchifolius]|uniref:Uncharacterized protein n=1 Tax=Smallanthus sonchifolius TaxID=185202 RepID=A0ACB9ISC1_9ASTR|nr:hypothetical protein L1987_20881 [Smallanthus sonchifolius]